MTAATRGPNAQTPPPANTLTVTDAANVELADEMSLQHPERIEHCHAGLLDLAWIAPDLGQVPRRPSPEACPEWPFWPEK